MNGDGVLTGEFFMMGDVACAEGAISAGCRFFAGYPITPATEVAERMAERMPQVGGTYIQMDNAPVHFSSQQEGVEVMAMSQALEIMPWRVSATTVALRPVVRRVAQATGMRLRAVKPVVGPYARRIRGPVQSIRRSVAVCRQALRTGRPMPPLILEPTTAGSLSPVLRGAGST